MDPEQEIRLRRERDELYKAIDELLSVAESEKRELNRRETVDYNKLVRRVKELDAQIPVFDPRFAMGSTPATESSPADVLSREQRMTDWLRARGRGDVDLEGERLSLGAIVQAFVSGDRRGVTDVERRAMSGGVDAAGGFLIPELLSAQIIDRARAQAVAFRAGAITAPMGSDTLHLARLATGNAANWKAEGDPVVDSDQVWQRITLTTKTLVVSTRLSRELFEDLSNEANEIIEREISQAIALKLDLAILEGSGTPPEPRGIANTTGVNSVSMGANGGMPTGWDPVVQAVFAALKQNSAEGMAGVFHPRDLETLALLKDSTAQPLRRPAVIQDLPLLSSTQIATNVAQGTSTDTSRAYIGDWSTVIVGVRPSLQIRFRVLEERYADNLQVGLLAWLRGDVVLAHPEHMTKLVGLRNV
jgi:HK97 family phage major capsid protein